MSKSKLVVKAMLKDAAEAINQHSMEVSADVMLVHQQIVLTLADEPFTQITLVVRHD